MSPQRRRWREMSSAQRGRILVVAAVQLGLQVAMLVDLRGRPAHRIRGDKRLWVAASFVNVAGPVAYFLRARR